jgi:KDO2-lipid IV(A) lauroyltransferase
MILRAIRSAAVWYLYFPHLALLRRIGPRAAVVLTRIFAYLHWAATLLGSGGRTLKAMRMAFPEAGELELRRMHHRHLVVKYQAFVEWHLFGTQRGRKFVAQTYHLDDEGRSRLDGALAKGHGVVALVFHYGLPKMTWAALDSIGHVTYQHLFRGTNYAGATFPWVARAALEAQARSDKQSGLGVIYQRPNLTYVLLVRQLKKNSIIGMAADGMMGNEFVTVPFLGGTMEFPTGPARVAASTGADIVPFFVLPDGLWGHRIFVEPSIPVPDASLSTIETCVRAYGGVLDKYVRLYPWAWWTWRRLQWTRRGDGSIHYVAKPLSTEETYHDELGTKPQRAAESSAGSETQPAEERGAGLVGSRTS